MTDPSKRRTLIPVVVSATVGEEDSKITNRVAVATRKQVRQLNALFTDLAIPRCLPVNPSTIARYACPSCQASGADSCSHGQPTQPSEHYTDDRPSRPKQPKASKSGATRAAHTPGPRAAIGVSMSVADIAIIDAHCAKLGVERSHYLATCALACIEDERAQLEIRAWGARACGYDDDSKNTNTKESK